jgi:glycosyltransferase involved in cell wall biosynthesis
MRLFKDKISIIMPAYNEGVHIYQNLRETHSVLKKTKVRFEIILVNDGSSDNTYSEARRAAADFPNIVAINIISNGGKGNALKEGFSYTTGDYIVFLDADLDLHPEQLHYMLRIMRDEQAEVVTGSKHHPDTELNYPASRRLFSKMYAFILKILFDLPLRDTQTGLKIFKREVLERVFPVVLCKRYAFDVELLANAHRIGYKVIESPVVLNFRRQMKWGRIGLRAIYHLGMDTLAIFYRMHIRRYYDRVLERPENSKDC